MQTVLPVLLTTRAARSPGAPAVRDRGTEISYGALDLASDSLAARLVSRGVHTGDRVGILLDKSIEAVVSIFGILKAGACYVPLDPQSPALRQSYILKDCGIRHVVHSSRKEDQLSQIMRTGIPVRCPVNVDEHMRGAGRIAGGVFRRRRPGAHQCAYILYTSGSTGKPKGVCITHRASLAFVNWAYRCFSVSAADRVASHAPFHFDLSIFDIFVSIRAGACISLVPAGISAFPRSLSEFIEKELISIWYSVPYVLIQLAQYGQLERRDVSALRQILYAGEEFPVSSLRKLMKLVPRARVYNLYGPTETNVCTYYRVRRISPGATSVPIGKPCAGARVAVLRTDKTRIRRAGERGELFVTGPTLMKGYWNASRDTEAAFVKHSDFPGKKLYRTGDMVILDKEGNYVFAGRTDSMVKRKGYRIELKEIQAALYGHPGVLEAAASVYTDTEGEKRIQAEVVCRKNKSFSEESLRAFCLRRLPVYMVPDAFVFRRSLPRTSTGKLIAASGVRRRSRWED